MAKPLVSDERITRGLSGVWLSMTRSGSLSAGLGNLASICRFAFTRIRPLPSSLQLLRAVYGHHVGASEDLSARHLRLKVYRHWYNFLLPPRTSMHLLLQVLRDSVYEPLTPLSSESLTIFDCGANVGLTALYFADRYPGSLVHAFEPSKKNFEMVETNTRSLRDRILVNQVGVADVSGTAVLHAGEQTELHSLHPTMLGGKEVGSETIQLVRLEEYLSHKHVEKIDLLKLDVEGSELNALKGLGERIRDVGVIVGELHLTVVDEDEFRCFLEDAGFTFHVRSRPEDRIVMFEAQSTSRRPETGARASLAASASG